MKHLLRISLSFFLAYIVSFEASSFAFPIDYCPTFVKVSEDHFNQLKNEGLRVDIRQHQAQNHRVVLILKLEVQKKTVAGDSCYLKRSYVLSEGLPNESIQTIIVTGLYLEQNGKGQVNPVSIQVSQKTDMMSSLAPNFADALRNNQRAIEQSGGLNRYLGDAFSALKPALAVRGAGCLMCHARIDSNIITDFGMNNDFFFGGEKDTNHWYSQHLNSWSLASVYKNVIIPKTIIQQTGTSLIDELANRKMTIGAKGVKEATSIYIGAPTEKTLLKLMPELTSTGFQYAGGSWGLETETPTELVVNTLGNLTFVTHTDKPINCNGDLLVRGVLFLKERTKIVVGEDGCRIYVAGTIYIQSPPELQSADDSIKPSIQLTSSRAVIMGFSQETLAKRISISLENNLQIRGDAHFEATILNHEANALSSLMRDSGDVEIDSHGMLLNAPIVFSRILGHFSGSVIAEIALFRVGKFRFSFDKSILNNDILPLLEEPVLKVEGVTAADVDGQDEEEAKATPGSSPKASN